MTTRDLKTLICFRELFSRLFTTMTCEVTESVLSYGTEIPEKNGCWDVFRLDVRYYLAHCIR